MQSLVFDNLTSGFTNDSLIYFNSHYNDYLSYIFTTTYLDTIMSRIVISTSSSGLDNLDINHKIDLIRLRLYVNNVEFIDGKNITNDRLLY